MTAPADPVVPTAENALAENAVARLVGYAEGSLAWRHGEKTEDELLQRIWNLAGDVKRLAAALAVRSDSSRDAVRDEMTCDRCKRHHGVVWFAPSDIWNAVMREGDRGKPDEYSFCCPLCFMQLADARGIKNTGWLVIPDQGQFPGPAENAREMVA